MTGASAATPDPYVAAGESRHPASTTPSAGSAGRWWRCLWWWAEHEPARTALVTNQVTWSFADVAAWTDHLVAELRDRGVAPGSRVVCAMTRSCWAVAAPLAVAKAGGVYVPVDRSHPVSRLTAVLDETDARLLLTDDAGVAHLTPPGTTGLLLPGEDSCRGGPPPGARPFAAPHQPGGQAPAYILYTSGSSGRPKGVVVGHDALDNLLGELENRYFPLVRRPPGEGPVRVAHGVPLSFDASWDPLLWMLGGHELHLVSEETRADPELYADTIRRRHLDVVEAVPTLVSAMLQHGLLEPDCRPRLLLMGGEALATALWARLRAVPDLIAVNLYGPTEATVFATACRSDTHAEPLIGRPITRVRTRVVGPDLRARPSGESGELLLGGACLAQGYLGQPELTARSFVHLPGPEGETQRWYRTGDVCRVAAPDGSLEYLGRMDDQVKIRGVRVEPGESEHALLSHPAVLQAVVRPEGEGEELRLVAYVVLDPAHTDAPAPALRLRDYLRTRLPGHLLPSAVITLESMPTGPHGKIDRAALPFAASLSPATGARAVPPRTPAEELVASAWSDVLGAGEAGVHSDFFEAGGHSLSAAQLASRLRAQGVPCSLRDVMSLRTIARLATLVPDSHFTASRKEPPHE